MLRYRGPMREGDDHEPHDHHPHHQDRGSRRSWLKRVLPHRHSHAMAVDRVLETSAQGIRAVKISLVGLLLTTALQAGVVIVSGSVALLSDTLHNFGMP